MCLPYMGDKVRPNAYKLEPGPMASQHLDYTGTSTICTLDFHSTTLFLYVGDSMPLFSAAALRLKDCEKSELAQGP